MVRGPSFDRSAVVERAMEVFWQQGYQGASLSTLGPAMGLLPGSIYAAFGSKEALFREALGAYVARIRDVVARAELPPRALIERWFEAHTRAALDVAPGELGRGCLLLASAAEAPRLDSESAAMVRAELDTLERFFRHLVTRARAEDAAGEIDKPGAAATARLLVAALAGISTLSRAGVGKRTLDDIARAALVMV